MTVPLPPDEARELDPEVVGRAGNGITLRWAPASIGIRSRTVVYRQPTHAEIAEVALLASGLPAQLAEWRERAQKAEVRAEKAEGELVDSAEVACQGNEREKALCAERDALREQIEEARRLVWALAVTSEASITGEEECEELFDVGLISLRRDFGDEYVSILTADAVTAIRRFLSSSTPTFTRKPDAGRDALSSRL